MARSEFDELVSFSKAKAKSGDREMLFGKINKHLREQGFDIEQGFDLEFKGDTVTVRQLGVIFK